MMVMVVRVMLGMLVGAVGGNGVIEWVMIMAVTEKLMK